MLESNINTVRTDLKTLMKDESVPKNAVSLLSMVHVN